MRAREILDEDYNQSLESDLNNLLIAFKGNGGQELPTQKLADRLQQSGYSVTPDSLMALLQNNPIVANVSPELINLVSAEADSQDSQAGQPDDSASHVSDMAKSATKLG